MVVPPFASCCCDGPACWVAVAAARVAVEEGASSPYEPAWHEAEEHRLTRRLAEGAGRQWVRLEEGGRLMVVVDRVAVAATAPVVAMAVSRLAVSRLVVALAEG